MRAEESNISLGIVKRQKMANSSADQSSKAGENNGGGSGYNQSAEAGYKLVRLEKLIPYGWMGRHWQGP